MWIRALLTALLASLLFGQSAEEDFKVYTEHPRLLLTAQKLKLLRRERERGSVRWQQFELLLQGKAAMPEPGFAGALFYQVAKNEDAGRAAIAWSLSPQATDVRQLALVYDWCFTLLNGPQTKALQEKLLRSLKNTSVPDVTSIRSRALAAIALADAQTEASQSALQAIVQTWWRAQTVPALKSGKDLVLRSDPYALFELLHVVRDNLNVDLRENAGAYFRDVPATRLLSYYPAAYPAAENEYRIPFFTGRGEPDLRAAALSRAADLSLVAYDINAVEAQFLQGWLIHDRFLMKGAFGAPYELLWANPYQPGLSFFHMPLRFHDQLAGRLLVRSHWEEEATWLGYIDGEVQLFQDGKIQALPAAKLQKSMRIGDTAVLRATENMRIDAAAEGPRSFYILGLEPRRKYDVEIDDEELAEHEADAGGILAILLERGGDVKIRLKATPGVVSYPVSR